MINFKFDINKIIQIVNYLLKRNDGRVNYTKLIKLLYIADKEFFGQWDISITQDSYESMSNGPVLSKTYDLIKDEIVSPEQAQWNCLFTKDGYDLILLGDNNLPTSLLCEAEIQMLDEIDEKFKDYSYSDMIEYTHRYDLFPEVKWEEAGYSSIDLSIENILISLKRTPEEIEAISQEIHSQQKVIEILLS